MCSLWQHLDIFPFGLFGFRNFPSRLCLMAPPSISSDADENYCVFYRIYKAFVPVQLILSPRWCLNPGSPTRACASRPRSAAASSQHRSAVSGTPHPRRLCPKPGSPPLRPHPADTPQKLRADKGRQTLHTKLGDANSLWPKVTF